VYVKSILDHLPNPDRGAALEKKMWDRLIVAPTNWAYPPIGPPPLRKVICHIVRFWMISQEKRLHLGGAQAFQTMESMHVEEQE
jgi:hypothetical protein